MVRSARASARRLAIVLVAAALATPVGAHAAGWRSLFDGKTLAGWTPKIAGYPLGENWHDTFVVKDGAIRVSYAGYDRFQNRFGHLIYKTPFKAYRLRLSYRFLDPGLPDTPVWARSNSGVMFHGQPPETMGLNQPFPVSLEFQMLGRDGDAPRPTGAVCTPGTNITIGGAMAKQHCTPSTGPTIPNGTWTRLELEVTPDGHVTQTINGQAVLRYERPELDPTDPAAKPLIERQGGVLALTGGYISLQSEGHPVEFKDIRIQELKAR